MSKIKALPALEALEQFREAHPDVGLDGILAMSESAFVAGYADAFGDDPRKARSAYREAQRIRALATLLWANIKDTVGSAHYRETLFNNIPQSFLDFQGLIPSYPQLFGNLDFIECDHARSIFGPAAYFVDLLRFIEKYIPQDGLDLGHRLAERQPRIYRIALDRENTYTLIPYIDLVNEVLEDVVRTSQTPDAYQVVAESVFPMSLPFHLPLAEIRLYLKQLKLSLQEIYRLFDRADAAVAREILELSPRDYARVGSEITDKAELDIFYGMDVTATGKGSLRDVAVFGDQTGLSRTELDSLLFLDLSPDEVDVGLARLSFIQAAGDGHEAIRVENNVKDTLFTHGDDLSNIRSILDQRKLPDALRQKFANAGIAVFSVNTRVLVDRAGRHWRVWDGDTDRTYVLQATGSELTAYSETYDRLNNLTLPRLDRIYRFLKLQRRLGWSFADLDWALRSLADQALAKQSLGPAYVAESVLQFDGVNDWVQIPNAGDLVLASGGGVPTMTVEAWVFTDRGGVHPILAKGSTVGPLTQFQLWITPAGQVGFQAYGMQSDQLVSVYRLDANGNYFTADAGAAAADPDADGDAPGFSLISHGALPAGRFNHVAVSVNEAVSDGGNDYFQLKFYLNGVLDSTWSFASALPVEQEPADGAELEIRLGTNFEDDFLAGSLSDVRLWKTIRSPVEIQRSLTSRLRGDTTGLVGYWPLLDEGGDELSDRAPGAGHPGIPGGTTYSTLPRWIHRDLPLSPLPTPISDTALQFNGRDDFLAAQNVRGLEVSELTVEAWVKLDQDDREHGLIIKGDAESGAAHFRWRITADNKMALDGSILGAALVSDALWAGPLPTDRMHLAVTMTEDTVRFYVNGERKGERSPTAGPGASGADLGVDLFVGRDFTGGAFLQAALQEVRIWRVARTRDQLRQTRDQLLSGSESGLVGYWRLDSDELTDGRIPDLSFNQNGLYPGGNPTIYRPVLESHEEALLPTPVARPQLALSLDPDHYALRVVNPGDHGLGHYEQFTLQLWFRVDNPKVTGRKQVLFSQGDADTGLSIYLSADGRLRAHAWCADVEGTPIAEHTLSTIIIDRNTWYQLSFVYDETSPGEGVNYRFHLDGRAADETSDGFRLDQVGPIHVGGLTPDAFTRFHDQDAFGNRHRFGGVLSDLRLWKRALPAEAITHPSDARHPRHLPQADDPDLLCYLPMTEGYGAPVGEHEGLRYAPDRDDPTLLTPIIRDQTALSNGRASDGHLVVGPDPVTPKWSTEPRLAIHPERALRLAGGHVRLADTVELGLIDSSFTVEFWLQADSFDSAAILIDGGSTLVLELTDTGHVVARLNDASLSATRALEAGTWHHLAWRFDRATASQSLLIDGRPAGQGSAPSAITDPFQARIGPGFGGALSDLRLWNVARGDQDIASRRELRLTGSETNLVGYWPLEVAPDERWIDRTHGHGALLEKNGSAAAAWVDVETAFAGREIHLGINSSDARTELVDLPKTDLPATGTLEMWVRFDRAADQTLLDASTDAHTFRLAVRGSALVFELTNAAGDALDLSVNLADLPSDFDGQVHHVAGTWNFGARTTTAQLHLDDLIVRAAPTGTGGVPALARPRVGLSQAGNVPFTGVFHRVRLWDHVRDPETLRDHVDADLSGDEAGLGLLLSLDEESGNSLIEAVSQRTVWAKALPTVLENPEWTIVDHAVELDGQGQYIDASGFTPGVEGTIELWVKFSRNRDQVIFDASNGELDDGSHGVDGHGGHEGEEGHGVHRDLRKFFALQVRGGALSFRLEDAGGHHVEGTGRGRGVNSEPSVAPGDADYEARISLATSEFSDFDRQWHHVVATWRYDPASRTVTGDLRLDLEHRAELRMDINSGSAPSGKVPPLLPLFIGANTGTYERVAGDAFGGQVRQVRIWNQLRSEDDLRALRDRPLSGDEDGLAVYLPIDEGSGTQLENRADASAPATVVLNGGQSATWRVVDRAIRLSGTDQFIAVPDALPQTAGTIELFARFAVDRDQILVDASDSDDRPFFVLDLADRRLRFRLDGSSEGAELDLGDAVTTPTIWHHVVATWSFDIDARRAALEVYFDDRPAARVTLNDATPREDLRNPYIGIRRGEATALPEYGPFQGEIRQIRLWSVVRDAASIDRFRRIDLDGDEPGLVSHLPIDEGQGSVLHDSSDARGGAQLYTRVLAEARWGRRPGQLWQFGPSYAVLPGTDALGLVEHDFTIESWIRLPDVAGPHPLLGTRGPAVADSDEVWSLSVVDGRPRAQMQGQTLNGADLTLQPDTWHHLALRYQGGRLTLWLDGAVSAQSLDGLAPVQARRRLHVAHLRTYGGNGVWNDSSLAGFVDELRVWGVALADATLQAPRARRIAADTADLNALWRFDRTPRLLDHSSRRLHPVLVVDEAVARQADFSASGPPILLHPDVLSVDGYNDYLDLGEPWVRASDSWSVAFWFRLEQTDGIQVLFEHARTVRASVQDSCFQVEGPFASGDAWEEVFIVQPGEWTHVAIVHDAGQLRIIRNGAAVDETRAISFDPGSAGGLRLGAPQDLTTSANTHLRGLLAEVELWARARTESEVSATLHHPLSGREHGLEAYFPVAEGPGALRATPRDVCELQPDGTLVSGLEDTREKWQPEPPPIPGALSALALDGRDDHVALSSLSDLLAPAITAGGLCVEAWVKQDGDATGTRAVLGSSAGLAAGLCLGLEDGRPVFALGTQVVHAELTLGTGWHHLAWTHDAATKTATIVLNGVKVAEGSLSLSLPDGASAWLGRYQDAGPGGAEAGNAVDRYFAGSIGEVRLWSGTRSVATIADQRGQRLMGNESALIAYWIFDDRHRVVIPSQLGSGNYQMILASDRVLQPPLWGRVDDHPVLLDHLSRHALAFDGDEQYLGLDGFTSQPRSFTVEAWVMSTQSATDTRPRQESPVLWRGQENVSGPAVDFELRVTSGGNLAFHYRPTGEDAKTLVTSATFAVNRLTHVAVTVAWDSETTIGLYIDGALDAETTEASALRNSGSVLRVGWGNATGSVEHFRGLIQELRFWSEARTEAQISADMFIPLGGADRPGLLGYWPLSTIVDGTSPNLVRPELPFSVGGTPGDRCPEVVVLVTRPTPFLDPEERVLSLERAHSGELPIPPYNAAEQLHRKQRTIEVWFTCERPNAAGRQVIYQEGDDQRGLSISIENGVLTFTGFDHSNEESAWQGTTITSDHLRAGRWHHAALVLDGRGDVQDNGFSAMIDGRLIDVLPGSQVSGTVSPIVIGGLAFDQPVSVTRIPASDPRVQRTGRWHLTGQGFLHDHNKNKGDKSLTWPFAQTDGLYRLGLSHPVDNPFEPAHASNLSVEIAHAGGTDTVIVDLRRAGGQHPVNLGEYHMVAGSSSVTVSNADTDGLVIMDALHLSPLYYRDAATPPAPVLTAVSLSESERLHGQIKEVRVWERVRHVDQIRATRFDISAIDAELRSDLLFHWQTRDLPDAATAPLRLPRSVQAFGGVPATIDLINLAALRELSSATDLAIERLCVLFAGLRYAGNGDESTLFDSLFNRAGTSDQERWSYYPSEPRMWVVASSEDQHRATRSRLMGAFRVSHADLDLMVAAVSGVSSADQVHALNLDGPTLTLLYRLRVLATVLGLSIADVVTLMARLRTEVGLNELASLTLGDVDVLRERAAWHKASGIDVAEYEYLVYDQRDRRVKSPYDDGSVVDGATDLTARVLGALITPASLVSAEVNEAASDAVYRELLAAAHIEEISLTLPGDEGGAPALLSVVMPGFERYSDLTTIARTMDWAADFEGQVIGFDDLVASGLIDELGRVTAEDPASALRALIADMATTPVDPDASLRTLAIAADLDPEQSVLLRDLLGKRQQSQKLIPEAITAQLQASRDEVEGSMLTTLANLLASTTERVQAIITHTEGNTYQDGALVAPRFLSEMNAIAVERTPGASPDVQADLEQLNKTLFLLGQFTLSSEEIEALLTEPSVFDLQPASLLTPTLRDLETLHDFVQLKSSLSDPGNRVLELIQVESEPELAIEDLTGWRPGEIRVLAAGLGISDRAEYTSIPSLTALERGFSVIDKLGSDAAYLIDLSSTEDRDFATYRRQSGALLELVRGRYGEDKWPRVFEPIHDILAQAQRDALVAVALENLADQISGRKSPDVLYEYLLIDVQTGSVVDTSRIVQATAALQLYVQRCRMSLEKGVNPGLIPEDEWLWMKNYRVWEANRKVFLYPENYIEPELRDTKTPLFVALEDELNQVDVDKDTAAVAYTHYLDSFAEVTNLTIVGSYLDTDRIPPGNTVAVPEFSGGNARSQIIETERTDVGDLLPGNFTIEMWVNHRHAGSVGGLLSAFTPETRTLQIDINPLSHISSELRRLLILFGIYDDGDFDPIYQNHTIHSKRGWGVRVNRGRFEVFLTTHEIVTGDLEPSSPRTIREETVLKSSESYPADRWFHLAVTYDGHSLLLYVDGTRVTLNAVFDPAINLAKTRLPQGSVRYQGTSTRLVLASEGAGNFYNGQLREVRVWNTVRSPGEIRATMLDGVPDDSLPGSLVRYWRLDEGQGAVVQDRTVVNNFEFAAADVAAGRVTWTRAPSTAIQKSGDQATVRTTLYLVGRNEANQEYYLRRLIDGIEWTPWEKIDLSISAEFVAPVFAFNKLYLFWAEIQDSVRAENRRWVNRGQFNQLPKDQLGKTILLKTSNRPGGTVDPRWFSDHLESQIIDDLDGGYINTRTGVSSDKNGVIEQVNITVQKPVIKYSYHNFSNEWTQPQEYATLDVELDDNQQRQPKWRRIYAQRWRQSEVGPVFQAEPTRQDDVTVARMVQNSFVATELPAFTMDEFTVSYWFRIEDLAGGQRQFVDRPATNNFTLFDYDDGALRARLTHQPTAIEQTVEILAATEAGRDALLDTASDMGVRGAIGDLVDFRSGAQASLDAAITALNKDRVSTLIYTADQAGDAVTTDPGEVKTSLSKVLAKQSVLSAEAARAALQQQSAGSPNGIALSEKLAQAAERARDAASAARGIAGQDESVLDNVNAAAARARSGADTIKADAESAATSAESAASAATSAANQAEDAATSASAQSVPEASQAAAAAVVTHTNSAASKAREVAGQAEDAASATTVDDASAAATAAETAATAAETAASTAEQQEATLPDDDTIPGEYASAARAARAAATAARTAATAARSRANALAATATVDQVIGHLQSTLTSALPVLNAAVTAESAVPKYDHGDIKLSLATSANSHVLLDPVAYGVWYHLTLVMESGDASTTVTAYLVRQDGTNSRSVTAVVGGANYTFSNGRLPEGKTLSVGAASNPSGSAPSTTYRPWMSEFQLWNRPLSPGVIQGERYQRRLGTETGLQLHLGLDRQASSASALDLQGSGSGLSLDIVAEAQPSTRTVERILLMYGENICSLRSNVKDVGNVYKLLSNANTPRHDLSIVGQGDAAFIGQDSSKSNIVIEAHRSSSALYPLDRYRPVDRISVLKERPSALQDALTEWELNVGNPRLLQDRNGAAQLDDNESYIMDVHNQPGSYILDIGDEIFLVEIKLGDQRLRTAEERLQSERVSGSTSTYNLYFDRERILEVTSPLSPVFRFTRLNTFAAQELSERLFGGGIDALLTLESQEAGLEKPFTNLADKNDPRIESPERNMPAGIEPNAIDFNGAYGPYYSEIFFHIPFLIANQLSANQQFEEAQRWYHYIFDPTARENQGSRADRFWRYRPFRHLTLETLSEILTDRRAIERYRTDPFDPHAIAALRINAYQKAVVMKYIDNLLDWGDYLFRQDTRESINEAIPLYVLAFNLLGERPRVKQIHASTPAGDLRDVQADIAQSPEDFPNDADGNEITDFLFELSAGLATDLTTDRPLRVPFDPRLTVATRFCVPENAQFIGFWDRVEDRLFKIRNSLNIDGVFRSLALFQPPIDPAALVSAVAGGGLAGALASGAAAGVTSVPHYRFSFMLAQAKGMVGNVMTLGGALLNALEKRDAEALTILQQNHAIGLLELTTTIKELQIKETELNKEALQISKRSVEQRRDRYQEWIDNGLSTLEVAEIGLRITGGVLRAAATVLNIVSSVTRAIPDAELGGSGFGGSPVATVTAGGSNISGVAGNFATALAGTADAVDTAAGIVSLYAGYERREDGWKLERDQTKIEIENIDKQIEAIDVTLASQTQDLRIHRQNIAQEQEVAEFLQSKFSNQDLYNWMANRITGLYFQSYKLAFDLAKQAEAAYQFEFGATDTYISFGHWDSRRKGLLAGESLLLDLNRLEKSALDQDSRCLEITRPISLVRLDPMAFIELKTTGRCQFSLGELLFDRDFPGHYFRIIKAVSLSIPAVVGPYQTIKATLTQTGHKTLLAPDISGVDYLLGESDTMPASIRADWRANQQIALSTGVDDSGVFELNFNDDRYLPFEGTGAVSTWLLEMPLSTNAIDFDSISDVIINLRYMCKTDGGKFKQDVANHPVVRSVRGQHLFSVAREFTAEWHAFTSDSPGVDTLTLRLPANLFPLNVVVDWDTVTLEALLGVDADGALVDVSKAFTDRTGQTIPPMPLDPDSASPRFTVKARSNFDRSSVTNLLVLVTYDAELRGD